MSTASEAGGLWLPYSVIDELREDAARSSRDVSRYDQPVNFYGYQPRGYNAALGNQPQQERLLAEGTQGWAATGAAAVALRVSGLKLTSGMRLIDDAGKEIVEPVDPDHPQNELYRNPNPDMNMSSLLWLTSWHLQLAGVAYWQRINVTLGSRIVTTELWPMMPNLTAPVREAGRIVGYQCRDDQGHTLNLERAEVIMFSRPDPGNFAHAMGKLGPQATEFDAHRAMEKHLKTHFETDAIPRVVLTTPAGEDFPGREEIKQFDGVWRQSFHALDGTRRGTPAFLPPGVEATELAAHGGTTDIDQMASSKRDQILSAFGVPKMIVGLVEDVNRSSAEASRYVFDVNTITPDTSLIAAACTMQMSRDFDADLVTRFKEFVEPDREQIRLDEEHDMKNGVRSVRQILRDRPDANEDDAPWGEYPIMPFGVAPYTGEERDDFDMFDESRGHARGWGDDDGDAADHREPGGSGDRWPAGAQHRQRAAEPAPRGRRAADRRRHQSPHRPRQIGSLLTRADVTDQQTQERRLIRDGKRYVPPMARAVQRVLAAQYEAIKDALSTRAPVELTVHEMRGAVQRASYEEIVAQLFNPAAWDDLFERESMETVGAAFSESADRAYNDVAKALASLDLTLDIPKLPKLAADQMREQGRVLAVNVNTSTQRWLASTIARGMEQGDDIAALTKRLAPGFGRQRARTIARTEALGATEAGQLEGWKQTGQVMRKRWHNNIVGVRDTHMVNAAGDPMDGYTVGIDEYFVLSGPSGGTERARAPRDNSLSAGNRVNCKCYSVGVVAGVE